LRGRRYLSHFAQGSSWLIQALSIQTLSSARRSPNVDCALGNCNS